MLLRSRRAFFRKEMTYAELREYYKDSTSPIPKGKKPTKEQLQKIRDQLTRGRKRYNFFRISITWLITICLLVLINYSYNNLTFIKSYFIQPEKSKNYELIELEKTRNFEAKLARGISQFEDKEYFLAIGNFKHALRYSQDDSLTNIYLARAYFRMCKYKHQTCEEAKSHAKMMLELKPSSRRYQKLYNYYLDNKINK